jgi:sulfur-oxidizing protein SoxX
MATTIAGVAACIVYGCASAPAGNDVSERAEAMMKSSFKAHGQATLARLDQDETQRLCSDYAGRPLPTPVAERIEKANLATIRYPADGKLVGDWKSGEKIAQSGQGFQYSDDPKSPAGANCYACHQLSPQELSYGTIGPSLYHFGKNHGYTDETRRYAWRKIYNAEAFAACSNMPRFGYHHILTEQQMRDVVALLVDPASPVNQ